MRLRESDSNNVNKLGQCRYAAALSSLHIRVSVRQFVSQTVSQSVGRFICSSGRLTFVVVVVVVVVNAELILFQIKSNEDVEYRFSRVLHHSRSVAVRERRSVKADVFLVCFRM